MKTWDEISLARQIERWEQVLRVLRGLTRHQRRRHWNMGTWGEKTPCGTVACAAGFCGLDPWFRRRGLKNNFTSGFSDWQGEEVGEFFGHEGSEEIFYNPEHRTVGEVIRQVRKYLKLLKAGT